MHMYIKMKNKHITSSEHLNIQKLNCDSGKFDTNNTHIQYRSLSRVGAGISLARVAGLS